METLLPLIAALSVAGLAAGFVGGLFGVGGGLVIVPALYALYGALDVPDAVRTHSAVGTSLAVIILTSYRSLATHARSGALDANVLRRWGPWIAFGGASGAALAAVVSGAGLLGVFGVVALLVAAQMAFGRPEWRLAPDLPGGLARAGLAWGLGAVSALMGVGGGALGVTLMTLCGRPIHQAVATASGFGAAIAIPAALGFVVVGWGEPGLPPLSLGYVNGLGLVLLGALTVTTAPYGARLAHRLDQRLLRRLFAIFLAVTAISLLREALA